MNTSRAMPYGRLVSTAASIAFAFAIGAMIIYSEGVSPWLAFTSLFQGSFGSLEGISETLVLATPMLLCSFGLVLAFRAGIWNIGSEGQMALGAVGAAGVGIYLQTVPGLMGLELAAGFLLGAGWALLPAYLKFKLGVNEIMTTLMMNFMGLLLISYFAGGPWAMPNTNSPGSYFIGDAGSLPKLSPTLRVNYGFLITAAAGIAGSVLLWKTTLGYKMRAVGANPVAARAAGMNVIWIGVLVMMVSGGFAGVAGMVEVTGVQFRLVTGLTSNIGYDAILVVLLSRYTMVGSVFAAILFSALIVGSNAMYYATGLSTFLVYVIQGLIILFVILSETFVPWVRNLRIQK